MPNLKGNFKEEYIMEIWNSIVNVALPIIITGAVGLLAKLIYKVGDVLIDSAKAKKEESGLNQQLVQHKDEINTAKQVWNVVEEKYRITEKVEDLLVSKADMFDDLLLQKIPYLKKENLSDLRQAIAGEFNKGKQAVITDESLKQSNVELQNQTVQLVNTNNNLINGRFPPFTKFKIKINPNTLNAVINSTKPVAFHSGDFFSPNSIVNQ